MPRNKYTDAELCALVTDEKDEMYYANTENLDKHENAWKRFFGRPVGDERPMDADYQSRDINAMITATMAQMAITFSQDSLISFEAEGEDDEAAAEAESKACNKIVMERNLGFMKAQEAIQNGLILDMAILKGYWDIERDVFTTRHENVTDELELGLILESSDPGIRRELVSWDDGVAVVEVTKEERRFKVEAVKNERFLYQQDHEEQTAQGMRACGEVHYLTREECIRKGFDPKFVKRLDHINKDDDARVRGRTRNQSYTQQARQSQTEQVRVFELYMRLAMNRKDDKARLYKCWIGDGITDGFLKPLEPVDRVPYAVGCCFPISGRFVGEGLGERLGEIQDVKTRVMRDWIDNVTVNAKGRVSGVEGSVNMDDYLRPKRSGGMVRVRRADAINPIPVVDVGPSVMSMLSALDKDRTERGGASVEFLAAESQWAQDTARGTDTVYAAKELMLGFMTRNMAETLFRQLYLLVHAELRAGADRPIAMKIAGTWQEVNPREWRTRTFVNVDCGPTMGERTALSQMYMALIQLYTQALQGGLEGIVVSYEGLHDLVVDFAQNGLVPNPSKYLIDPRSDGAQQRIQQNAQMAMAAQQAEARAPLELEELKVAAEQMQQAAELQFKYFETVLDAAVKGAQTETEAITRVAESADVASSNGASQQQ